MRSLFFFLILASSMAVLLLGASPQGSASLSDRLTAALTKEMEAQPGTGAAVGVVRNGQLIYVKGFGMRNVAAHEPIDATTRFEIGSVTKQFTAAAILQLKEQGKLALDDRLVKYVPSFPHARDVTLRQLLNQVSGLANYTEMKNFLTIMSSTPGSLAKIADYAKGPLRFKPGTQWEYSNTNYYVLGRVVEVVSHQSYDDYVRKHLFAAARMSHSDFTDNESKLSDFATPYWQGVDMKGAMRPAPPILESWAGGAGAIVSTVGDLAAWDTALAAGTIVSHTDYGLMSKPFVLRSCTSTAYGMGLAISELDGHKSVSHNGGTNGSLTTNATFPSDNVDIIVFENSLAGDPRALETVAFEVMFPAAAAAANRPAAGEIPAVRIRALHLINEALHGSIPASEMSPEFQKIAIPQAQQQIAKQLARFGAPTAVIYTGKGDRPDATRYTYRALCTRGKITFIIILDKKTKLLDGMGIRPE